MGALRERIKGAAAERPAGTTTIAREGSSDLGGVGGV